MRITLDNLLLWMVSPDLASPKHMRRWDVSSGLVFIRPRPSELGGIISCQVQWGLVRLFFIMANKSNYF